MRITGGSSSGLILKAPKGLAVRPTPDLVRQAVFNSLGSRVGGSEVLELFGGSGALSLECLSRGAAHVVCVESSGRHARFIRSNLHLTPFPAERLEVRTQDAMAAVTQLQAVRRRFGLVLADPPYGEKNVGRRSSSFAQRLLDHPHLPELLREDGLFVLGHSKRDTLEIPAIWTEVKVLRHGDTVMRFLRPVGVRTPVDINR